MINVTSLREQVYQYLREEMQSGRLLQGSTINPTELSERLGISKTPLRDALIRLESEGFVEILPRRGVKVNTITLRDVKNFYDIIGALEGRVILDVFERLEQSHIDELRRLNSEMRDAIETEAFDVYYTSNLDFHEVYLELSGNMELRRLIKPMKQRLYDFPRLGYIKEWEFRNCDEHERFINLIEAGDRKGSASVMEEVHWSYKVQEKYIRMYYSMVVEQIQAEQALRQKHEEAV